MDALRAIQLLTDLAYLLLGIAAIGAALRHQERARLDVAILFGALAGTVALQEISLLSCFGAAGCLDVPWSTQLTTVFVLVLPYALSRLVDDIADVPKWQMWASLALLIILASVFLLSPVPAAPWLVVSLTIYLIVGTGYAALAFARLARSNVGITRRRMAAVAWGCGFLAATIVLAVIARVPSANDFLFVALSRVAGLISGLSFWAGFFPPNWLSQTWRLPELLRYLQPTRLMASPIGQPSAASDAMVIDLCAATAATTGAQRVFLILKDAVRHDLYLWGAPSVRMDSTGGPLGRVLAGQNPLVLRDVAPNQLPAAVVAAFGSESLPRTAMLAPIALDGSNVGVLAAFAEKGPMFVEDDVEVVSFFAGEAAAILRMERYRQSVNELEALREADRLKDEFMAVVSHELRTPLTAITGYSDILLRKLSGPLNERQERQVVGVRDAARRLLLLINDLLDVSKLEAGTLDLHLLALNPRQVVAQAATALRVIAATKGVTIEVRDAGPDDLLPVRADDERLQQILTNLVMNSIKFTPQGGSIWIDARSALGQDGPEIVFRVEDTGVGLTPTQAARVWDRFYQAESSSTRRFGGAGLGLSIVRRLAELHGGRVEAHSAGVDRGSTFEVYLPASTDGLTIEPSSQPPVRLPASVSEPPVNDAEAQLVLVVEDDPHIATVLRTYLEADGYSVEHAKDGRLALQLAQTLHPFAITLDISLPKLDGWSVLNALKHEPTTADIPVVIVSTVDNRDFGMVLGAAEYLLKPIDHDRLRSVLRGFSRPTGEGISTVLIVDDDPVLRDVLGSSLAEDGWRVTTAPDGEAALAAVKREKPTAMVLDLMMPRVDGFEVLRALREQPNMRDLPVIVVTARELTDEDRKRLAQSAERVILKQALRVDELRAEIRGLLVTHRSRGSGSGNGNGHQD